MSSAQVIRTNGQVDSLGHKPTLEEAQSIVGGYVELITLGKRQTLIVNEEGILMGLPTNPVATVICGKSIFGNAILLNGWRSVA